MQYLSVVVLKSSEVKTFTMGYHAYNSIWTPTKDEQWHDAMQPTNVLGKYVVEKSLIERIEKEKVSNNPSSSVRDVWKRSSSPSLFHSILNFPPCFSSFLLLGFFELNIFLPKLFGVFLYLALEAFRILISMICQNWNALLPCRFFSNSVFCSFATTHNRSWQNIIGSESRIRIV